MSKLWREVVKLDIYDLNFAYSSKKLNILASNPSRLPRKGVLLRIGSFFWHLLNSLGGFRSSISEGQQSPDSVLFFSSSKNQSDSLEPVFSKMDIAFTVCGGLEDDQNCAKIFPTFFAYFISIIFFPVVLLKFLGSKGYRRESFHFIFDRYLLTYGYYILSWIKLEQISPRALVVSNDHNMSNRVVVDIAKKQGIPTFYVQHASVTSNFPPLSFDYALLEGLDALEKYENAGPSRCIAYLIGMPKSDAYLQFHNNNPYVRSLGICVNMLDPVDRIYHLCGNLRQGWPDLNIHLRPHPRDRRSNLWKTICKEYQFSLSNSKLESSFEFLKKVDAILAGDSNIVLEAALMNVYPIYYDFAQTGLDWYGFQRNGLVEYFCKPEDVIPEIKRLHKTKPSVRERAKIYCATIGTVYDGRSAELACNLINSSTSGAEVDENTWIRVPNKLEAYQLIS